MGTYQQVYVGPYVRVNNRVISTENAEGPQYLGCANHPYTKFSREKFCPACGSALQLIRSNFEKKIRISSIMQQHIDRFYDKFQDIQGYVEEYDENKLLYVLNRETISVDAGYGVSSIFDFDSSNLNEIEDMKQPNSEKYSDFYALIDILKEYEAEYKIGVGYIQYWA